MIRLSICRYRIVDLLLINNQEWTDKIASANELRNQRPFLHNPVKEKAIENDLAKRQRHTTDRNRLACCRGHTMGMAVLDIAMGNYYYREKLKRNG